MAETDGERAISLARFVLDTLEQIRTLAGESTEDADLAPVFVRSITLSIPCDQGAGKPSLRPPSRPLRPADLLAYLMASERNIVLNRACLLNLPEERLGRIELTVEFGA
jgi:hypothetical protein